MLDFDRSTPLNIFEYESVRDLIGKHLKIKLMLKRAKDIPEKYSFKTMAKYEWIDGDRTLFETQVREKQRNPDFGYVHEHIELVTEDFVEYLMYNTLTIKVMGMIESKKKSKKTNKEVEYDSQEEVAESDAAAATGEASARVATLGSARKGSIMVKNSGDVDAKTAELEKLNRELLAQIEELKLNSQKGKSCCAIF